MTNGVFLTRWFLKLKPLAPSLLLNGRSKTFHFALYPCQERFSILDYLDANHLAALVVPSQKTFPLSRNSLIKTRIWFRSSPGKTCCNSLNGVPTSLFCRMCLQNFTTRKLRFYPGSLSSASSPASASLGTHRTALNDWGERSGKTRASQHIRYSCVGLLIASYSA